MSNPGICEDTSPRQMTLSAKISHFKASLVVILVFEVKELQSRYQTREQRPDTLGNTSQHSL